MNTAGVAPLVQVYRRLTEFLDDARDLFPHRMVCFRLRGPSPASASPGFQLEYRLELPGFGLVVGCQARVVQTLPDRVVLEVLAWQPGHEDQLWTFVAVAWKVLQEAGVGGFQAPPPGGAAQIDLEHHAIFAGAGASRTAGRRDSVGIEAHQAPILPPPSPSERPVAPPRAAHLEPESRSSSAGASSAAPTQDPARHAHPTPHRPRMPAQLRSEQSPAPRGQPTSPPKPRVRTRSLRSRPLWRWLYTLMLEEKSGWLEVSGTESVLRIRLQQGQVVQIEQRPHLEVRIFTTVALALGLPLTGIEAHKGALERSDAPEALMVELDALSHDAATRLLSRRLSIQLARAIPQGWEGSAGFLEEPGSPPVLLPSPPIPLARLIWDGLRARAYTQQESGFEALRHELLKVPLRYVDEGHLPLNELTTRTEELDLLSRCRDQLSGLLHSLRSPEQVERAIIPTCWMLLQLGVLRSRDEQTQGTMSSQPSPQELQDRLRTTMQLSYFERLDLHWSVHPDEIKRAYEHATHPYLALAQSRDPAVSDLATSIRTQLEDAYDVLSDPPRRQEYRKQLVGGQLASAMKQALEHAELASLRNNQEEALRWIELANELLPGRSELVERLERQRKVVGIRR